MSVLVRRRSSGRLSVRAPNSTNYAPGAGLHVSVATRAQGSQLATVAKAIADTLPLTLQVDRAALIDSSTGETWPLEHVP